MACFVLCSLLFFSLFELIISQNTSFNRPTKQELKTNKIIYMNACVERGICKEYTEENALTHIDCTDLCDLSWKWALRIINFNLLFSSSETNQDSNENKVFPHFFPFNNSKLFTKDSSDNKLREIQALKYKNIGRERDRKFNEGVEKSDDQKIVLRQKLKIYRNKEKSGFKKELKITEKQKSSHEENQNIVKYKFKFNETLSSYSTTEKILINKQESETIESMDKTTEIIDKTEVTHITEETTVKIKVTDMMENNIKKIDTNKKKEINSEDDVEIVNFAQDL